MAFEKVKKGLVQLIKKAETEIPNDVISAIKNAYNKEENIAKTQLDAILKNIELRKL